MQPVASGRHASCPTDAPHPHLCHRMAVPLAPLPASCALGPQVTANFAGGLLPEQAAGPLPYLPDSAIRRRFGAAKWLWAEELLLEDLGLYR